MFNAFQPNLFNRKVAAGIASVSLLGLGLAINPVLQFERKLATQTYFSKNSTLCGSITARYEAIYPSSDHSACSFSSSPFPTSI